MNTNILFLTNIICPILSGIPLFMFALYFFYAEQGLFRQRTRFFSGFLLAFSLYILCRPLQLPLGAHPWPMIINALRMILFVGLCCPLVLNEAYALCGRKSHIRLRLLLVLGGALAVLYVLLLIFSPGDSPLLFELASLKAYDYTPLSLTPPLYARELTILILMLAGTGSFGLAGYQALRTRHTSPA